MNNDHIVNLVGDIQPLVPAALKRLQEYLDAEETPSSRGERERAKLSLQIVNTAITIQRAAWTQQRHQTTIAKILADGDLDKFAAYVHGAMPGFPQVREAQPALP